MTTPYRIVCSNECGAVFEHVDGPGNGRKAAKELGWQLWTVTGAIFCPLCWVGRSGGTPPGLVGQRRRILAVEAWSE